MHTCERILAALGGGERGLAAFVAFAFIALLFGLAVLS